MPYILFVTYDFISSVTVASKSCYLTSTTQNDLADVLLETAGISYVISSLKHLAEKWALPKEQSKGSYVGLGLGSSFRKRVCSKNGLCGLPRDWNDC